jgi:ethanolamine utilization protein EutQ (cupin superfamily)
MPVLPWNSISKQLASRVVRIGESEDAPHEISEFANVSRPGVRLQTLEKIRMKMRAETHHAACVFLGKVAGENRNVFLALAQGGSVSGMTLSR